MEYRQVLTQLCTRFANLYTFTARFNHRYVDCYSFYGSRNTFKARQVPQVQTLRNIAAARPNPAFVVVEQTKRDRQLPPEQSSIVEVEKLITGPKNLLQNLTHISKNQGKVLDFRFSHKFDNYTKKWEAQLKMIDSTEGERPRFQIFKGSHSRKSNADANASIVAVAYLIHNGVLDRTGKVIIGGKEERRRKKQDRRAQPVEIQLTKEQLTLVEQFLSDYNRLLPPALAVGDEQICADVPATGEAALQEEMVDFHILTGDEYMPLSADQLAVTNSRLFGIDGKRNTRKKSMLDRQHQLPIFAYRDRLLDMIQQNQVLIVAGETGSGKSTQLPQYILDYYIRENRGAECGTVVTQPRRISALSLSERVAFERNERLGESIGYQVRLDGCIPRLNGFVFYCTTGTMVNMLRGVASSSKRIQGLTHLIIDEVHIRDAYIDILLTAIKLMLPVYPNLRVILMSASMDHKLLSSHFNNCPVVDIPGRMYSVTERYLPDVMHQIGSYSSSDITAVGQQLRTDPGYVMQTDLIHRTIEMIDRRRPLGAILCFLPGWQEIQMVHKVLTASKWYNSGRHVVHRLHSKIPLAEQRRVFQSVGPNRRKIILATNVAESSITVDDVRYVIDTGLHRDTFFDADRNTTCLKLSRTAKANTIQRKGRAGRVAAGECFFLFDKESYDNAPEFPMPEIKRMPLETVCLESKLLAPDVSMPVADFLRNMPEPPVAGDVEQAVQRLVELGVFSRSLCVEPLKAGNAATEDGGEQLTDLGRRIAHFTSHPRMSIALLYSRLLRCTGPIITFASMYTSSREPFLNNSDSCRQEIRIRKRHLAKDCDWQAISHLMRLYRECYGDDYAVEQFCRQFQLDADALKYIESSRAIFVKHLSDAYLLSDIEEAERNEGASDADCDTATRLPAIMRSMSVNENELSGAAVRAAICAGYGDQLGKICSKDESDSSNRFSRRVFMLDEGRSGELSSQSAVDPASLPEHSLIAYGVKRVYERDRHSRAVLLSDATHVHPLHVLLFTRRLTPKFGQLLVDAERRLSDTVDEAPVIEFAELPFLKMRCRTRQEADALLELRTAIHRTVESAISSTEFSSPIIQLLAQLREIVAKCIPEN